MLTAEEATIADNANTYPRDLPREERIAARQTYMVEQRRIESEFAAHLGATYLPTFNAQVQERVYQQAREHGGGFQNIEIAYSELAEIFDLI